MTSDDAAANSHAARTDCADGQCDEALVRLEAYLDGQLPESELAEIREHLVACYPCTGRASFEEQLRAIVRRDCVDHAPPSLLDRIASVLDSPDGHSAARESDT